MITNYIITHKKYERIDKYIDDSYKMLLVGACNKKNDFNYTRDDSGENISEKNFSFCELTGFYYIYKNVDVDVVGICHYRRIFSTSHFPFVRFKAINEKTVEKTLKNHDIILAKKTKFKNTVYDSYKINHNQNDLDHVRNIILNRYPNYLDDFDYIMTTKHLSLFNMLITRKTLFDQYCEWVFDILFHLEKEIDISNYDDYQKRVFGFLSERLLNVWVYHNQLKVKHVNVISIEKSQLVEFFKNIIKKVINKKYK